MHKSFTSGQLLNNIALSYLVNKLQKTFLSIFKIDTVENV